MDCKVPVMFTYLGIIIIFSTFGHAYAETTVFNIDSATKCGNDIIVREGDTMKLTFQSPSRYVNLAFCNNESTKNLNTKLNISNGQTITFDIVGREEYEGLWNCSFLTHIGHYVRDTVTYDGEYYAPYANCSLMVRIQRDVTLTVSSTTTTNLVAAKATDIGYYRFIEGNKITFDCKKGHTNGEFLQSGYYLVFKFCWKDKSCSDLKTKSTLVRDTMELNSTFDGSILHCIYNNSVGYQTDAAIVLQLQIKAQSRPEITVEGLAIREPRSSESKHTFDGTVNQTLELVCTNKENWGNIHWEVCDGSGLNFKSQTLAADKILKLNFTLSADNKNTTVKCVHIFNALREETPVFLYANEPPVLTSKNDMILNYTRGTDTYVIEREDEETIRIKCKSRETSGSLSWRDCNNAARKSCNQTQDIYNRSIEKVIPWNSEKNEVFFYCVYKNSRNYEVSSKVKIVVHPRMSTRSTTTVTIPSSTKQTPKASVASSEGQSQTILKIIEDGDEASGFTNGQTLCFSCYDTNIDAKKCIIKLITAGQDDVEVPVKQNGKINNRNSYSGCLEMNFTSTDVEVKCLIFRKANDEKPSTIKLLRLTRKNPDFEPEGHPDLSNTILGESTTILNIKKDGDEASSFTNGEKLCFSCYDTKIDAKKCIIKLITAGQDDVEVPVVKENEKKNNRNSCSGCLEMNFTSTDVEVKCLIFRNASDEKPSRSNLLRLTRKNPVNAAEATTARFGQTPKETSKSSNSSPTKSPDVVTPPRSASSATSSKAPPELVTPKTKEDDKEKNFPDMYIYIIVGVVVALIIITQRAVVLYLKCKAKRTARLESLSLRAQDQDDSSKRYSSSPGVKISAFSRIMNRKSNRDDNDIYETVEEVRNAERETSPEPNISKRPPLPLPIHSHEAILAGPRRPPPAPVCGIEIAIRIIRNSKISEKSGF